ncbi:hypothetical protein FPOAC2_11024 [Fusarium poae]|uniref:Uncharacterized protein n=1 Tax=Fusarium poae TaxID=36050 RepID=A0A1B8ACM6_FUSPO|nr:hypothetical protein FPOAC1_010739 [Fusarium poae]KAG8665938.1 hypothetical protein FPOAC1_010739 [Fusarium poae]OBS18228.1 hypothetical protein FPOA_09955 [Fusarium poae]
MGSIQDLPNELLLQVMEHCGSDLLQLVKAYPTALSCFSENRKSFVARMSNRFRNSLDFSSFLRPARLRYIRQERNFSFPKIFLIEDKISQVLKSTRHTTPPELHKFSLSALCSMSGLGEDAKLIIDEYSKQALANMAKNPGADFYVTRQSKELTQDERRRFMTAAITFESYCLTFFNRQQLLHERGDEFRQMFFKRYGRGMRRKNAVGRFYCIMFYILQKHRELLSNVAKHLESIHGRVLPSLTDGPQQYLEKSFLNSMQEDYETRFFNHLHYLTSQGLGMLARLQKMSIEELTGFVLTTYLDSREFNYPAVSITMEIRDFPLGTQEDYRPWLPWIYLDDILEDAYNYETGGYEIWEDTWSRAIPFWDPSEDECPYIEHPYSRFFVNQSPVQFWFLYRAD